MYFLLSVVYLLFDQTPFTFYLFFAFLSFHVYFIIYFCRVCCFSSTRDCYYLCFGLMTTHTHTQTHHPQSQGEEGGERPAHMCDHRAWQHFGLIEVNPWLALTIFYAWLPFAIPRSPFPLAALRFVSIRFLFDFVAVVDVVVVSIKFTTQNAVGQTNKQTSKSTHRQTNKQTKPKGKHFYKVADDANEKERPPPLPAFRGVTLRNWRPQTGYLRLATVSGGGGAW